MRTKRIVFILLSVLVVGTASGQEKINEMLRKIEAEYVKYTSRQYPIEVNSETEKDRNGNIIISRKLFVIRAWPALATELEKAFDQEKERAAFVTESAETVGNIRKIVKRYFFRVGDSGGLVYQMFGTTNNMTFTYAYAVDAERVMRRKTHERGQEPVALWDDSRAG